MKTRHSILAMTMLGLLGLSSCGGDDDDTPVLNTELTLTFTGLNDLGEDYRYEGWVIVDGSPVSAGTFTVDAEGTPSKTVFEVDGNDLSSASAYVLTIEPYPDNDPNPSAVHLLGGDFSDNQASLSVGHSAAIGNDFLSSSGKFILATPTNGMMTNENSGVWFLSLESGAPAQGLDLPTLPAGWKYEGWQIIGGRPVSTGKFTTPTMADDFDGYSSTLPGPPFPGEDFLVNAPDGLSFPTDLSGTIAVISVEPNPDNSPKPFTLKPLVGNVPMSATDHFTYPMDNNAMATNPTGTASK